MTVAVAAMSGALLAHGGRGHAAASESLSAAQITLAVASSAPLLGWRRWPMPVFVVIGLVAIGFAAIGDVVWLPVGPAAGLYLLAVSRTDARPWTVPAVATVLGVLAGYLAVASASAGVSGGELVHSGVAFAAAWAAGERTRLRHEHLSGLRARAERAERDAARERDLAVAEERTRIARDLHDSAAHALNVIAIRAGAARLRHDPDRDQDALAAIEDLARQTMTDIDHTVAALRRDRTGEVEVPPGLAALDTLIGQHRASGHDVDLIRTGQQLPLAVPVEHGAYRILQEALTNAARHGDGATTAVALDYGGDTVNLTVTSGLPGIATPPPITGHGLIGMRERAASLDGELTAERDGDRFVVRAVLPYSGHRP